MSTNENKNAPGGSAFQLNSFQDVKNEPVQTACCEKPTKKERPYIPDSEVNKLKYFGTGAIVFALWYFVYSFTADFASYITFDLLGLEKGKELGLAIEFFLYDTVKILLLLVMMVYAIGWLRASMNTDKVRDFLAGKARGFGYLAAGFFGAITPFCSCSSVPLFIAFTNARIPIGITMSFLITSPLINEVAVVLLWGLLGWKFTVVYIAVGIIAGMIGGFVMDSLKAERWLQDFLQKSLQQRQMQGLSLSGKQKITLMQRHYFAQDEMLTIAKQVWKWVIIGVGIGAILHGYVPQAWFEQHLSTGQWWSVPLAVAAGIPLYTNVTGIIPIMESLLLKGLPAGTTLAFCMSAVGASLPEILMLKQVMKPKLLVIFVITLLIVFTVVGWIFNHVHGLLV